MVSLRTPLGGRLGIEHPSFRPPTGSAGTPELAAAVSNAGAPGMLSVTWRSLDEARQLVRETRWLLSRRFGVNLVLEWPTGERLRRCLDEGVRSLSVGLVTRVKPAGKIVSDIVDQARAALARL